jgi:hypothetical protein
MQQVICPYCNKVCKLVTGDSLYRGRQDLSKKKFYWCSPCSAHVGCHPGSDRPLGSPADPELRQLRQSAHQAFDVLWKKEGWARGSAYKWLAAEIGIPKKHMHIGQSSKETCRQIILAMQRYQDRKLAKEKKDAKRHRQWLKRNRASAAEQEMLDFIDWMSE